MGNRHCDAAIHFSARDGLDCFAPLAMTGCSTRRRPLNPAPRPPSQGRRKRFGAVAQLGERCNGIAEVRGSIPLGSTNLRLPLVLNTEAAASSERCLETGSGRARAAELNFH